MLRLAAAYHFTLRARSDTPLSNVTIHIILPAHSLVNMSEPFFWTRTVSGTGTCSNVQGERPTDKQMNRWIERQTDEIDRQTDGQTSNLLYTSFGGHQNVNDKKKIQSKFFNRTFYR